MEIPMAEIARYVGYVDQLSLTQFKRWNQRIRFIDFINVPIFQIQLKVLNEQLQKDIVDHERTEKALLNAAQQWRATFDGISDIVSLLDMEGRVLRCNKAMTHLIGKPFSEILNRPYWEIIHGKTAPIDECPVVRMKQTLHRETVLVQMDGRWFNIAVDPVLDETGCLIGSVHIMSDVTERKQGEEALRLFEKAIETLQLGLTITDSQGRIIYTNPAEANMHGYQVEELIGKDVRILAPREIWNPMAVDQLLKMNCWKRESINMRKDGSTFPVYLLSVVVPNIPGDALGVITTCEDITERKKAEEALKESEDLYRDLVECSQYLICTHDLKGQILSVNKEGAKLLGYDQSALLNKNIRDLLVPKFRDEFDKYLDTIETHGFAKGLMLLQTATGENRVWEYNNTLRTEGVTAPIVRAISHDVTEHMQAEKGVKTLAQENAVMAEIGRIISSTLDINEVYERFAEEVNKLIPFDRIVINIINIEKSTVSNVYMAGKGIADRKVGEIYPVEGSGNDEMVRTKSSLLIQTEDFNEYKGRFPMLLSTFQAGFRSIMNVPLFSKGRIIGGLLLRSLKPYVYTDKDVRLAERVGSQIAGAIANAQLFIERKRAEEALRQSEEKYRTIVENIQDGYLEVDLAGNFTFVNDAQCRNLGYTREELIGMNNRQYTDETTARKLYQTFNGVYRTGEPVKVLDLEVIRKDGTKTFNEISVSLIRDSGGKPIGFRAIARDVTERKRAEEERLALQEQLRQSQKMEAIGKLAGGVAHDFNNLLTVIQGYSELILKGLNSDNRLCQDVREILNASERASSLTRQLLAFSRKQVLQPKVLDLNDHVPNMDKMLRRMIGEDVELVTLLAKDLGRIKADPGQIEQVILNLAVNAKDAMLNGGKLTIETANVKLDESYARSHIGVAPGHYVMLSVSDTGAGMTPEIKERIFEPFFTTKEEGKGTGLGLSTVYGIVQQSGGNVWVYSEPGVGTTFKIYLPTIEEDTESLRPTALSTKSLQGSETILLVEDEETVRKLACTVLQKYGYTVLEAPNGEEALRIVQGQNGNPIHLMVTDVVMPGMSGRQLAERLVSLWPKLKVLYMSGYTDNAIVHHGVLDPGIAYIQKPFAPDALASKVREILDGE